VTIDKLRVIAYPQFVTENGDCRRKPPQSPFSATVWTGLYD